jgi:hypothetical protein
MDLRSFLPQLGIDLGVGPLELINGACTLLIDGELRVTLETANDGGIVIHTVPARLGSDALGRLSSTLLEANANPARAAAFGYDPVTGEVVLWARPQVAGGGGYGALLRAVDALIKAARDWQTRLEEEAEPAVASSESALPLMFFRP